MKRLRQVIRFCLAPVRWVFRFGLGGKTRTQKILRRTWLALFLMLFVVIPLCWAGLIVRFNVVGSANQVSIVDQINSLHADVPKADHAWPLIEQAFAALSDRGEVRVKKAGEVLSRHVLFGELRDPVGQDVIRDFATLNTEALDFLTEASRKKVLGIRFEPTDEIALDALTPAEWKLVSYPRCHRRLRIAFYALRTAFVASVLNDNVADAFELLQARLRLIALTCDIPEYHVQNVGQESVRATWRDISFVIGEWPHRFSDAQLSQLEELVTNNRFFFDRQAASELYFDNLLDQLFASDGFVTARGAHKIASAMFVATGDAGQPNVDLMHRELLAPNNGVSGRDKFRRLAVSKLVLPAAVCWWPNKTETSRHLDEFSETIRELQTRESFHEIHKFAASRGDQPAPTWAGLPFRLIEHDQFSVDTYARKIELQQSMARLAIQLEQYKRRTGDWPETLSANGITSILDPYTNGHPLSYEVRNGVPYVWSVGRNFEHDTSLDAANQRWKSDWLLLPVCAPAYLEEQTLMWLDTLHQQCAEGSSVTIESTR
jgi:hypothetical protein